MNLANEKRPTHFDGYVGQKGAVNYIKSVIKTDKHPPGIIISGMPGTGKTTLATLYTKGTLCENRKEGEFELCGKCDSCLNPIEKLHNVTYYRITEASTFKEAVGDLISETKAAPMVVHDNPRADNQRRFIIIDELQNATRQSISPFLDSLEFAVPSVTVILISMDLDKLDAVVRDAIESRCIELQLDKLNTESISSNLQKHYNTLDPSSADLLAYLSRGNMRKAWSFLDYFSTQMATEEITPDVISSHKLGGLSEDKVDEIIDSIENRSWVNTEKILKSILDNETQAVDYFLRTILKKNLTHDAIELVSALSFWLQCDYKSPILSIFIQYQGRILLVENERLEPPTVIFNKVPEVEVAPVEEVTIPVKKPMVNDLLAQMANISGKKVQVDVKYPFFNYTKWSQFLTYYADCI